MQIFSAQGARIPVDDDVGLFQAVRRALSARGAALALLVRVIRTHKEVLLLVVVMRVGCVRGGSGACVVCWAGAGGL